MMQWTKDEEMKYDKSDKLPTKLLPEVIQEAF